MGKETSAEEETPPTDVKTLETESEIAIEKDGDGASCGGETWTEKNAKASESPPDWRIAKRFGSYSPAEKEPRLPE